MKMIRSFLATLTCLSLLAVAVGCQPPGDDADVDTSTDTTVEAPAGPADSNVTTGAETPDGNVTTAAETPDGNVTTGAETPEGN